MRIRYIILAHQLPSQVVRLVRRLMTPDAVFYLHWDRRSPDADLNRILSDLDAACHVEPLRRHACHWGTFSIVAATLEGIAAACAGGPFDRLVLLSGQDYPIKSAHAIESFFGAQPDRSFVHRLPLPKADWPDGGWDRIRLKWEHRDGAPEGVLHAVAGPPRTFPDGLHPHGGAQFWAMTGELARFVHEFSESHPEALAFFEHVFAPDEIYIQSVVASWPRPEDITNDTLHFLEWRRPGNVLLMSDVRNLAAARHLFARKFDARVDGAVFDAIDEQLLGVAPQHA